MFVKDESARLGLPAFKVLGASWAVHRALAGRTAPDERPVTLVSWACIRPQPWCC